MDANILCLKWGTRYPALFVNRLYAGAKRHMERPFRFVCATDDPSGLDKGIEAAPFPEPPPGWKRRWPHIFAKLAVFRDGFAGLEGPTLFLDIDQIITGGIDCFFDWKPGSFCMIRNWIELRKRIFRAPPKIGNSSCFRVEAGKSGYIWEKFLEEQDLALDQRLYRTEQAYMTHAAGKVEWWPADWVRSFKRSCARTFPLNLFLPPKFVPGTRILCFHGNPDPDQAVAGFKGRHLNATTLPAPWVADLWENG